MTDDPARVAIDGYLAAAAPQSGWDRDRIRQEITLSCDVRLGSGSWAKVVLLNLTDCGFQIDWLPNCRQGSKVWIRMPGLQLLSATVRWQNNIGIGCEFAAPLYEPVFEHLVRLAEAK
jgi:hypothetical protein